MKMIKLLIASVVCLGVFAGTASAGEYGMTNITVSVIGKYQANEDTRLTSRVFVTFNTGGQYWAPTGSGCSADTAILPETAPGVPDKEMYSMLLAANMASKAVDISISNAEGNVLTGTADMCTIVYAGVHG